MAASPNPLQGSLFNNEEASSGVDTLENKSSNLSIERVGNQELKDDADLRPRSKKRDKNQINNVDGLSKTDIEEPKWSHHSLPSIDDLTPALRHYVELKIENPDRVLLYRLGDFFECFFEDAVLISNLLEITLTSKDAGKEIGKIPMAGVPYHAMERYCADLIKKNYSVVICDQLEKSSGNYGTPIKRVITRIITPGTVIEEGMLIAKKNNWITAIYLSEENSDESYECGIS